MRWSGEIIISEKVKWNVLYHGSHWDIANSNPLKSMFLSSAVCFHGERTMRHGWQELNHAGRITYSSSLRKLLNHTEQLREF